MTRQRRPLGWRRLDLLVQAPSHESAPLTVLRDLEQQCLADIQTQPVDNDLRQRQPLAKRSIAPWYLFTIYSLM
jgi:hypothetical protein